MKDLRFGLTLYELSAPVEVQYVNGDYVPITELTPVHERWIRRRGGSWTTRYLPTGRFALRAYAESGVGWQQEWAERKPGELLHRFRSIRHVLIEAVPQGPGIAGEDAPGG